MFLHCLLLAEPTASPITLVSYIAGLHGTAFACAQPAFRRAPKLLASARAP